MRFEKVKGVDDDSGQETLRGDVAQKCPGPPGADLLIEAAEEEGRVAKKLYISEALGDEAWMV